MLEYYRFKDIYDCMTSGRPLEARAMLEELQARYLDLCDESVSLRSQIQAYEDILYLSRNLIFDGSFYWLITGTIKQGPFCPACYNRDGLLLRLADDGETRQCLTCGAKFESFRPQKNQVPNRLEQVRDVQNAHPGPHMATGTEAARRSYSPRKATIIPFSR